MGRLRPWAACLALAAMTSAALPALAGPSDIANAEELFQRAKALMAKKKYADACPMFEESYRLDRAMGTLLNLALCHEAIGKTASAWGAFKAVEQHALAASPPRRDRAKLAHAHAAKLEPKLSRVKVNVTAPVTGLVLKVDGEEKGEPLFRPGITVDPGTRKISVTAPGKLPFETSVNVGEAATESVTIPALEDEPVAVTPPPVAPPAATLDQVEEAAAKRARRTTGFIVGGLGLVTAGAGAAFGVLAIGADADAKKCSPCTQGSAAADESNRSTDRALLFANISNVAIPVGGVLLVAGALLVLTSGGSSDPTPAAKSGPRVAVRAGPGAFALAGTW